VSAARFALAVLLVWVAPWRAARTIAEQREDVRAIVGALAYAVTGDSGPLTGARPDFSGWYWRPAAAVTACLMPWRAVRKLRTADRAILYLSDAILAQERRQRDFKAGLGIPRERPRHLQAVK
jgi:hypothetical protein